MTQTVQPNHLDLHTRNVDNYHVERSREGVVELWYCRIRRAAGLVLIFLLGTMAAVAPASAADPQSGSISSTARDVAWTGEYVQGSVGRYCTIIFCDRYSLTVDLPEGYWKSPDDGLRVQIAWQDSADLFRLCVKPPDATNVCDAGGDGTGGMRFGSRQMFFSMAKNGVYEVTVQYETVVESGYTGAASAALAQPEVPRFRPEVAFDDATPIQFAPATIVSPHFLGTEPMMALERPTGDSVPGALDPDRIFVDWPLGSTSATGQLSRSEDGGDSFRLLFDKDCPERNRPNCGTAGGGDTDVAVNPVNGHVYFTDLESLGNVALASSTDNGDTFPSVRQHAVSNPLTAMDRQWITGVPPGLVAVDHDRNPLTEEVSIDAFMSYDVGLLRKTVQGIDAKGRPVPQETPQIPDGSGKSGPLRIDASRGPGRGWLYLPAGAPQANGRYGIATVHASNYQKALGEAGGWRVNVVGDRSGRQPLFSWIELDGRGNAYTVWLQEPEEAAADKAWRIHFSFSDIDDPRNHPSTGRPGTVWSAPVTISLPDLGSTIFPQVTAGDPGRIAISYLGTKDHVGDPQEAPANARWDVYTAVMKDALARSGTLGVATGKVNHRTAHTGTICWGGAQCEVGVPDDPTGLSGSGDRSLADMMDIGFDADGRVAVVYGDNHSTFAYVNPTYREKPFPHFAKQISGPLLLDGAISAVAEPARESANDAVGDSTWPNTAMGRYLPSLDLLGASLTLEGANLVGRIPLKDATSSGMTRDLEGYEAAYEDVLSPRRLQYVIRFLTGDEIYHLSMERTRNGNQRFFAGKLDANDRLRTNDAYEYINGAGYHTDPLAIQGSVENDTLVFTAPAEQFGLGPGSEVFSVTAFAMAGPREADEKTLTDIMRTVDATPPFDRTLPAPEASPTPSETESPDPAATDTPTALPTSSPTPSPTGDPPEPYLLDLSPSEARGEVGVATVLTAFVTDAEGRPVAGAPISWQSDGVGSLLEADEETDATGRATVKLQSDEPGDQWVVGAARGCAPGVTCMDAAVRHHGPDGCDVFGTMGHDLLYGTAAGEVICAFGGNDVVVADRGDDRIRGGAGNDRLYGQAGRDTLWGRAGADELRGGAAADRLFGGTGLDLLFGGNGRDTCRGGENMKSCRP